MPAALLDHARQYELRQCDRRKEIDFHRQKNEQSLVTSYNVEAEMHEIAMECYQSAFKKAGVKKKDLEDPVTRKLIFDMINNQDAYKPNQEGAKLIAERKERKR